MTLGPVSLVLVLKLADTPTVKASFDKIMRSFTVRSFTAEALSPKLSALAELSFESISQFG